MRLPRLALSILIGASVAVSGVILQGIARNDLASPDTVGVNAGAGLGMMFFLVRYPTAATSQPLALPLAAVAGAGDHRVGLRLAYRRGSVLPARLLLVGIALGFGGPGRHAVVLPADEFLHVQLCAHVDVGHAGRRRLAQHRCFSCLGRWLLLPWMRSRAGFSTCSPWATAWLPVWASPCIASALLLTAAATVLTSVCVAIGGHIGFLGLAAPHLARRLVGQRHARLIPAAALTGAILLLTADSLARHVLAPVEIPAGVLVGILGGAISCTCWQPAKVEVTSFDEQDWCRV